MEALNYTILATKLIGRLQKQGHQYIDDYLKERNTNLERVNAEKVFENRQVWRNLTNCPT